MSPVQKLDPQDNYYWEIQTSCMWGGEGIWLLQSWAGDQDVMHSRVTSWQRYSGWCFQSGNMGRGVASRPGAARIQLRKVYITDPRMNQPPPLFFFFLNESKSLETFRRGLLIRDKFPLRPQIAAAFSGGAPVAGAAVSPLFFSRSAPLTKEGKKRLKKRQRQEKRSLSNALHRTMNFPRHSNVSAECLSDSLQQILKCDNGPQKWVMLSFCWFHFPDPPYPPWPVYLY